MTPIEAKHCLALQFRPRVFTESVGEAINESLFLELLAALKQQAPFRNKTLVEAYSRFLWSGCKKFDRWLSPRPYVYHTSVDANLAEFVDLLRRAENFEATNVAIFEVHLLRSRLYSIFNAVPVPVVGKKSDVEALRASMAAIQAPSDQTNRSEFEKESKKVVTLLDGLERGTLRTECKVLVPYPIVQKPLTFDVVYEDVPVHGTIRSSFMSPKELITKTAPPSALAPISPTRWQYGTTTVELSFRALIDSSARVDPLQVPMHALPVEGWPNIFRVVFSLLHEVSWKLRENHAFIGTWVPSPSDLGDIAYHVRSELDPELDSVTKSNPAIVLLGLVPQDQEENVDLGRTTESSWSMKCRVLAQQYMELGDAREALFWLNVGVEALLDSRMVAFGRGLIPPLTFEELSGPASYWDIAKSLVAERHPDIAETIVWPLAVPYVSMFRKINYFCKRVRLREPARKVTSNYANIQRHRNELFHGRSDKPLDPVKVKLAIESFDWLVQNFQPIDPGEGIPRR